MIVIGTTKCAEVSEFEIERNSDKIWLYNSFGHFSATADDWREIVRQVSALLEPAKVEAEPEETPDPRGYVFIDRENEAYGEGSDGCLAHSVHAKRPFRTVFEVLIACRNEGYEYAMAGVWTPECGVPPMPETQP